MATVDKNFRVKNGLVVEGSTATVNNSNIVTEAYAGTGSTLELSAGKLVIKSGSITNDMLAGSIANEKLANSAITINGTSVSLGGSRTLGTDDVAEGATNKYFTDERAQDAVAAALAAGTHTNITVTYDDNTNSISLTGAVTYTDENAQDAVGNAVGNGLDYNDETGAISVDPSEFALNAVGAPTGNVSMATYKITGLGTPTEDTDAATKAYVDAATAGLNVHDSVQAATTANIDLSTALENGDILDGVTLATGNRVLVKNQTTKSQNGVYIVQASGAAVRADDYNAAGEVDAGDFIFVEAGTLNAKTGWVQTNRITTLGTDDIEFTQFSGAGTYLAGTGLSLTGNTFAIDNTVTTNSGTQTLTNKTIDGNSNTLSNIGNASLSNSSITINSNSVSLGSSVTLDTDDISEGTTNKYFTDARAVTALEAVVPDFTAVEVNNISKQVAATVSLADTNAATAYSWAKADYRAAKFLVKFAYGSHTEVSEVLLTLDTSDNVGITEYAIVSTNGSLGSVTADVSGSDVRLRVTAGTATTTCHVVGTLIR